MLKHERWASKSLVYLSPTVNCYNEDEKRELKIASQEVKMMSTNLIELTYACQTNDDRVMKFSINQTNDFELSPSYVNCLPQLDRTVSPIHN